MVVLHELAHVIEKRAVAPFLYTGHGEMFNRIQLQLLEKYSDLDSEDIFYMSKKTGLFREEVSYEDIMNPVGLLSKKPLKQPMSREMG